jgi:hypothetical protein
MGEVLSCGMGCEVVNTESTATCCLVDGYRLIGGCGVVNTESTATCCLVDGYRPIGGRFRLYGLSCGVIW